MELALLRRKPGPPVEFWKTSAPDRSYTGMYTPIRKPIHKSIKTVMQTGRNKPAKTAVQHARPLAVITALQKYCSAS